MQTKTRDIFTTIRTEGSILPLDILNRIAEGDSSLEGLKPQDYHLPENETLRETISQSWGKLLASWKSFSSAVEKLPETDPGTTITRERWLLRLFNELGYGRLITSTSFIQDGRNYPISHSWQNSPIHLIGCRVDIDKRTAGVAGAARMSPHGMVQEFLNRSDDFLWGFVSNGLRLRILRDNISLTRQAYVEFDLAGMMDGEVYSDFVLLWLICHESRIESEIPDNCWLEKWSQTAKEQGTRALDQLRKGVEHAIALLGSGFLSYVGNSALKERLRSGDLDKQEYYRQLLRLVYRLIFLFVAEDRGLLLDLNAPQSNKDTYLKYYSVARLRSLAEKTRSTRHLDLWQGLTLVFDKLGNDSGCPEIALLPLGSYLWSKESISDLNNCQITNSDFLKAIRSLVSTEDSNKTRRLVDYKNLGSEELGSIYEALLELHPVLNTDAGSFELSSAGGNERKTTGSYYTHSSLVNCLLDSALDPVLDEALKKKEPEQALLSLKICDPACGSGHFLIAAAHRIARYLAAIRTRDDEPSPEATRVAIRDVIGQCVYGVDVNPMAVELCKVSLWMEALEPGKPLSFLNHHIQCGNSLLGTTPALLANGIPDEAFNPIEGDDKKVCQEAKKRNKQEIFGKQRLFQDEDIPWKILDKFKTSIITINKIGDDTIDGLKKKQQEYDKLIRSNDYASAELVANVWCAAFIWKKTKELPYPITQDVFRTIERNPSSIPDWMENEIKRLTERYKFFHWHLAFPDVFRISAKDENVENEQAGWNGGFDAILGNPPWERIKLQEKEWFSERRPDIASAPSATIRRRMIANLEQEDPDLHSEFLEERRMAEGESQLVRNTGFFPLCGRGDVNTYAVFAELMRTILNQYGRCGCVVPSGLLTDYTYKDFFASLVEGDTLQSFFGFENELGIFHEIHREFKFGLLTIRGGAALPGKIPTDFIYFAHSTTDLLEQDRHFSLTREDFQQINPNTMNCPVFRSQMDAEIVKRIYRKHTILLNETYSEGNPMGIRYMRMLDMTNDSKLFLSHQDLITKGYIPVPKTSIFSRDGDLAMPLYEGRMVWLYDHRAASVGESDKATFRTALSIAATDEEHANQYYYPTPRYWVRKKEIDNRLRQYNREWFIGFRDVTTPTAERTMVSTILPRTAVGNKVPVLLSDHAPKLLLCLLANFSSFIFDYVSRNKLNYIGMNFYILNQLPIISPEEYERESPLSPGEGLISWIASRAFELTYTSWDLEPLAKDYGWNGTPFIWNEKRRLQIKSELDGLYFYLYGINRDEVVHIMDTFSIVKKKEERHFGEYISKKLILKVFDAIHDSN